MITAQIIHATAINVLVWSDVMVWTYAVDRTNGVTRYDGHGHGGTCTRDWCSLLTVSLPAVPTSLLWHLQDRVKDLAALQAMKALNVTTDAAEETTCQSVFPYSRPPKVCFRDERKKLRSAEVSTSLLLVVWLFGSHIT